MLSFLDAYEEDRIGLDQLISDLEGSLNVLEERLPPTFSENWYGHLLELDTILALDEEQERRGQIASAIGEMKRLLMEIIDSQE